MNWVVLGSPCDHNAIGGGAGSRDHALANNTT